MKSGQSVMDKPLHSVKVCAVALQDAVLFGEVPACAALALRASFKAAD